MSVELMQYTDTTQNRQQINDYQLTDVTYTGTPKSVVAKAKEDPDRMPIMIMLEDQLAGFFCLHIHKGPLEIGGNVKTDVLLRALSIDERFRGQGISLTAMNLVSTFVNVLFPNVTRIILAVNQRNVPAQRLYQKAGFRDTGIHRVGKIGPQYVLFKMVNN
ncbi:GNAT family N-acetyltransferase [Furfurilactobacillus milii]|uniref:GNAT family N-acetyltransferase n=1 Tax=Furfurilactobacillus milii TaxID=2888272 RepID=A0ABT6D910_9LACO|nr:GNAT family N-acetyltransferase [Furfurilactobacillus milii]QLE67216.1 acetyltransferase [Furfurilactobacillus rossiae]MCF6161088.1 GNAT family N-acetyltransferase [Furfurilactobacillus milii]MCF6163422.1 GNAT family N-acetyltransferase [Furfurilactobacillus milii]MCF6418776.1 GNAT family N-acetyltransferase [Furfurilactobacillus milii]MDF9913621.1 GNAT family N-acetyltransferase [Furfurilactobacillus milii]